MNTQHTPGFWQTRAVSYEKKHWLPLCPDGKSKTTITQQSMAEVIAIVFGDDDKQAEANARLIAASPCLLEALRQVKDWMDAYEFDAGTPSEVKILGWVNSAIAKAEGR